jgi:hypothetical protein
MQSTMASAAIIRPLWSRTPGNKAHNNQLIICDGATLLKLEKILIITINLTIIVRRVDDDVRRRHIDDERMGAARRPPPPATNHTTIN